MTVASSDSDFAAALVAEVVAGGVNRCPLGVVNARCAIGIIAMIGPCSIWALGNYSILWFAHVGDGWLSLKTGAGTFPLNPANRVAML